LDVVFFDKKRETGGFFLLTLLKISLKFSITISGFLQKSS
jgi:hypothetical protein